MRSYIATQRPAGMLTKQSKHTQTHTHTHTHTHTAHRLGFISNQIRACLEHTSAYVSIRQHTSARGISRICSVPCLSLPMTPTLEKDGVCAFEEHESEFISVGAVARIVDDSDLFAEYHLSSRLALVSTWPRMSTGVDTKSKPRRPECAELSLGPPGGV
jgi:hypothetical protein